MRRVTTVLVFLLLCAALGPAAPKLESALAQSARASCCLRMDQETHDCAKQKKPSRQEQQCCASCPIALDLFLVKRAELPRRAVADQIFATYRAQERARTERPPVPPPRRTPA